MKWLCGLLVCCRSGETEQRRPVDGRDNSSNVVSAPSSSTRSVGPPRNDAACVGAPVVCSSDGWCADHPRPAANELTSIWGSGPKDLLAVGEAGTVLHFDGVWHGEVGATDDWLVDVWGSGPSDVYAVERTGKMLHYDGVRWSRLAEEATGHVTALWGIGPSDVWAVGAHGHAIHWNGTSWSTSTIGSENLGAVWGTAPNDVYASAEGALWHYEGHTWSQVMTHANLGPGALSGSSAENVFYGLGGIIDRWDGKTWKKAAVPWTGAVTGLWVANASSAFATTGDSILRWEGAAWTKQSTTATTMDSSARPQVNAVWGSAPSDVYAVGSAGMIHHFDGNAWSLEGRGRVVTTLESLSSVWGSSSDDLYAGGTNLLHYDGCAWTIVLRDLFVKAIWGTSKDHVVVLGKEGAIWVWDGKTWTSQHPPGKEELLDLWGRSTTDIYAVGVKGTTLHWTGSEWQPLPPPPMPMDTLTSVAGTPTDTYATDRVGVVYRLNATYWDRLPWTQVGNEMHTVGQEVYLWNSSGQVFRMDGRGWVPLGDGDLAGTRGFTGTGKGEYYTVGVSGRIQHWNGATWQKEASGFERTLYAVWASESEAVAVGENGVILRKRLE